MVGHKVVIQIAAISAVSERLNIQRTDARKLLEDARTNHRFNETSTAQEQINTALEVWKGIPEAFQKDIIAKKTKQQRDTLVESRCKSRIVHGHSEETKATIAKKRKLRDPDPRPELFKCLGQLMFFSA